MYSRQWKRNLCSVFSFLTGSHKHEVTVRSPNRKFNLTSPRANLGHLTTFCARGVGSLTGKAFRGMRNLNFIWVGWWKSNRKCQVSNGFFVRAPKSLTTINTCLDEMEEFKGRDIAISWVTVFFLLATEVSKKFCLRNSSLSYYWVETVFTRHIAYGTFSHPISMSKLYVSVKGNQPTLKYSKRHEVVNTCYVFSTLLNNLRRVSQSEELTLAYWHCPTW